MNIEFDGLYEEAILMRQKNYECKTPSETMRWLVRETPEYQELIAKKKEEANS